MLWFFFVFWFCFFFSDCSFFILWFLLVLGVLLVSEILGGVLVGSFLEFCCERFEVFLFEVISVGLVGRWLRVLRGGGVGVGFFLLFEVRDFLFAFVGRRWEFSDFLDVVDCLGDNGFWFVLVKSMVFCVGRGIFFLSVECWEIRKFCVLSIRSFGFLDCCGDRGIIDCCDIKRFLVCCGVNGFLGCDIDCCVFVGLEDVFIFDCWLLVLFVCWLLTLFGWFEGFVLLGCGLFWLG